MRRSSGFITLFVMVITTGLMLFVLRCWHKTSYLVDIVGQREQFCRRFYRSELILNAGISLVTKNIDVVRAQLHVHDKLTYTLVTQVEQEINGVVVVTKDRAGDGNVLLVQAAAKEQEKMYVSIRCLVRQKEGYEADGAEKASRCFVVSHVTLGGA